MVYNYMSNEGLTEVAILHFYVLQPLSQESNVGESGREVRKKVAAIKDLILVGQLDHAKELIEELAPEVLKVRHQSQST